MPGRLLLPRFSAALRQVGSPSARKPGIRSERFALFPASLVIRAPPRESRRSRHVSALIKWGFLTQSLHKRAFKRSRAWATDSAAHLRTKRSVDVRDAETRPVHARWGAIGILPRCFVAHVPRMGGTADSFAIPRARTSCCRKTWSITVVFSKIALDGTRSLTHSTMTVVTEGLSTVSARPAPFTHERIGPGNSKRGVVWKRNGAGFGDHARSGSV